MALSQEEILHLLVVRMLELKACSHLGAPSVQPLDPEQSDEHLRLVLVLRLDGDAEDSFLESLFLLFTDGEVPLVAIEETEHTGMVLLPDAATASSVLKDSNIWFDSLGLTLSSVSASVLWMSSETAPPREPWVENEDLSKGERLLNFTGTRHACSVISDEQALHGEISEPTTASTSISSTTSFRSILQTSSVIASPRDHPLEMNVELSDTEKQLACAGTASTSSEISEEEAPQDTIAEPTTTSARIDPRIALRRGTTDKLMSSLNAKTSIEEAADYTSTIHSIHAILEEDGIFLESVFFPLLDSKLLSAVTEGGENWEGNTVKGSHREQSSNEWHRENIGSCRNNKCMS